MIHTICITAAIGVMANSIFLSKREEDGDDLEDLKIRAAQAASRALSSIAIARQKANLPFSPDDVGKTGLIGLSDSPITTNLGTLRQKRATLNPNYAALIVHWLFQLAIKPGDKVALSITGSCPALNICLYSALSTMRIDPIIISSVGSSHYGANDPNFCWLDMEKSLFEVDLISFRSHLVSIGGNGDCGKNLCKEGADWSAAKIKSMGLVFLLCTSTAESIDQRMLFYENSSKGHPIKAYINVGGGVASVSRREKKLLLPGLNLKSAQATRKLSDSVMQRFGQKEVPLIHLNSVLALAEQHQFSKVEDGCIADIYKGPFLKARAGGTKMLRAATVLIVAEISWFAIRQLKQRQFVNPIGN